MGDSEPSATDDRTSSGNKGYAAAVGETNQTVTHEYVEIDSTAVNNPYHLPKTAEICLAINRTFGDDPDRSVFSAGRGRAGIYHIETTNIERYKSVKEVRLHEGEQPIAVATIKNVQISVKNDGKIFRQDVKSPNDLLITLRDADKHILRAIPNEDILREIIAMDIGEIKKSVQRQWDSKKQEYTGNKFFVLQNVLPEQRKRIPEFFVFQHPVVGNVRMWINHRHQIRRCWYCGDSHAAVCPIKQKIEVLKAEREQKKAELHGNFHIKTYSTSAFRYVNQTALASDVDAMSGATTGNVLNAVDVDEQNEDVANLVIVAGSNDKTMDVSLEEFAYTLKITRERLSRLNTQKKVVLVPPPLTKAISPEEAVKEDFFEAHLEQIQKSGILVVKNPVDEYSEDLGRHPSPTQSTDIVKAIDQATKSELNTPYILEGATDDVISLTNKYFHVRSLYKYGCAACDSKKRNKWYNLCDVCKSSASSDEEAIAQAREMREKIQQRIEAELPALGDGEDSAEDELKCEDCGVAFQELSELRAHFKDNHPGADFRFKRSRSYKSNEDEKKGRRGRTKSIPSKGLESSG